jgi:hypothetical protein
VRHKFRSHRTPSGTRLVIGIFSFVNKILELNKFSFLL